MISSIIDGIIAAILTEYPGYRIYTESVEQDLKKPCFVIQSMNPARDKRAGLRYQDTLQFIVQYFPETEEPYSECQAMNESLCDLLELISVNQKMLRGAGMNGVVVDNVLQFMITYQPFLLVQEDKTNMEDLNQNTPGVM